MAVPRDCDLADCLMVEVAREYDVFRARRLAAQLAARMGFSRADAHRLATAVSELANNLVFHADQGGVVQIRQLARAGRVGIEVIVEDSGPGIADLDAAMRDGFSTNGGLGGGLPGSRRLMNEFEIASQVGLGTKVVIRLWR
jgi:serine/threonine-protein kinase RsbT